MNSHSNPQSVRRRSNSKATTIEFNDKHIVGTLEELYWRDKILRKISKENKYPKRLRDYHVNVLLKQQVNQTEVLYKKLDDQFVDKDKQFIQYGVSPTEIRNLQRYVERSGFGKKPEETLLIQSLLNWHDNKTKNSKSSPSSPTTPISSSKIFPQSL